jgi:hypothetical protein
VGQSECLPDLKVLTGLHSEVKTAAQEYYMDFMAARFIPDADLCKEVFVINNAFRAWGHEFLYDRKLLALTMERVGFEDIRFYQPGVSDDEHLRQIESHGCIMDSEEINNFEAFAIEARAPYVEK